MNRKIIFIILAVGAFLIFVFRDGFYASNKPETQNTKPTTVNNDKPAVISTSPDPLEEAVVLPNQTIEITFNKPLVNAPGFIYQIEPKSDYKIELSDDRKTIKLVPSIPIELGSSFILKIQPDTKFDNNESLSGDIIYHFRTIEYKGV